MREELKKNCEEFLEMYVLNMAGLGLVSASFYLAYSARVLEIVEMLVPFLSRNDYEQSLWEMIVLLDISVVMALGLSVCMSGISDTRLNREALRGCFGAK